LIYNKSISSVDNYQRRKTALLLNLQHTTNYYLPYFLILSDIIFPA
jgi:hypothetical protein